MESLKIRRHITRAMMQKLKRSPSLLFDCPKCESGKFIRAFAKGTMKCTKCEGTYKIPT
jgi:uncharacterized protein (DUF983 family)